MNRCGASVELPRADGAIHADKTTLSFNETRVHPALHILRATFHEVVTDGVTRLKVLAARWAGGEDHQKQDERDAGCGDEPETFGHDSSDHI